MYKLLGASTTAPWAETIPYDPIPYRWIESHHPEWFLLDTNGQRVSFTTASETLGLDLGDPLYQKMWTAEVIRRAKMIGADGVMIDSVTTRYDWNFDVTLAKYPDRASYIAAMDSYVRYAVPEIKRAGLLVIGNGSAEDWDSPPWSDWIQLFDGRQYEPMATYETEDRWRALQNSYKRFPDKLYVQFLPNPEFDEGFFKFSLASFLIWSGTNSYAGIYCSDVHVPYHPLFDVQMGKPVGEGEQVAPTAYHRRFENGDVFVEISGTDAQTVDIPEGLRNAETGAPVPSGPTALQPHQALILIK
jgi:hypothetical protein